MSIAEGSQSKREADMQVCSETLRAAALISENCRRIVGFNYELHAQNATLMKANDELSIANQRERLGHDDIAAMLLKEQSAKAAVDEQISSLRAAVLSANNRAFEANASLFLTVGVFVVLAYAQFVGGMK